MQTLILGDASFDLFLALLKNYQFEYLSDTSVTTRYNLLNGLWSVNLELKSGSSVATPVEAAIFVLQLQLPTIQSAYIEADAKRD